MGSRSDVWTGLVLLYVNDSRVHPQGEWFKVSVKSCSFLVPTPTSLSNLWRCQICAYVRVPITHDTFFQFQHQRLVENLSFFSNWALGRDCALVLDAIIRWFFEADDSYEVRDWNSLVAWILFVQGLTNRVFKITSGLASWPTRLLFSLHINCSTGTKPELCTDFRWHSLRLFFPQRLATSSRSLIDVYLQEWQSDSQAFNFEFGSNFSKENSCITHSGIGKHHRRSWKPDGDQRRGCPINSCRTHVPRFLHLDAVPVCSLRKFLIVIFSKRTFDSHVMYLSRNLSSCFE